jgi:D-alanyl-D-alanine carboxypeptidase/D-alanyl-D-alanine-endopeptidase (penicillin-binding protein 4)
VRRSLSRATLLFGLLACGSSVPAAADAATLSQTKLNLKRIVAGMPGASSVYVREAATNTVLVSKNPTTKRIPASVTKLFTTSATLMLDDPAMRLTTEVLRTGELDDDGVLRGDLVVRGAGDPALRLDQIVTLADTVAKAGIKKIDGELRADLGGWTAQQGTGLTGGAYNREIGGRLGALVTLRGFGSSSVTDPARQVLVKLRDAMKARGITGTVTFGASAPAGADAVSIAKTSSPTLQQLVAATNAPSDNFFAEMLLRGLGARHGDGGTTAAGLAAERAALLEIGVKATLADGSGLSRGNRVAPTTIVKLLDQMAARPEGAALKSGLALTGATGTVAGRTRGTAASGRCRVKTGTLSNVSALAGWCTTVGKRTVAFAILNNNTSVSSARARQDRIASAIAAWSDPVKTVITPVKPTPAPTTPGATTPPSATAVATTPPSGGA